MTNTNRRTALAAIGTSLLAGPLLARPAHAQGRNATPQGFTGQVFVNQAGGIRLHTYLSGPEGALVTSHLIETSAGLVLVDGQFAPAAADEVQRYIDSLGQRVARVLVTHQHPDHWFGLHRLGRPAVFTGPQTARFLREQGAQLIADRKADSSVPEVAGLLAEGETTIGGVTLRTRFVLDTEAPESAVIELPQAGAVIVQDIVYNKVHAVVSRQIDNWVSVLRELETTAARTPLILAGHGEPAAPADLPGLVRYLETVKPMIFANIGKDPAPIVAEMTRQFPEYRLPWLLGLGLSRSLRA